MNAKAIIEHVDGMLKPLGFARQKQTWNRRFGTFVDVVDLQLSKGGDTVTSNVGVLHREVYATCWGNCCPNFIEEPHCTVRMRLGELAGAKDVWWKLDADNVVTSVGDALIRDGIPFMNQMHSVDAMEHFLTNAQVEKKRYPLPIIYLAILNHEQGNRSTACRLLSSLKEKTIGEWLNRIDQVAARLSCA